MNTLVCVVLLLSLQHVLTFLVEHQNYPFENTALEWDKRVDDLVGRLTVDEIMHQLSSGAGTAPAIDRLGIKHYAWWTNCGRGDRGQNASAYPQNIGLGATFEYHEDIYWWQQPNQKKSVGSNVLSGSYQIQGTKTLGKY